jgi:uncharacterized protein YuzE
MANQLRFKYDNEADAAYIYIDEQNQKVSKTIAAKLPDTIRGEINLDFDSDNKLVGIELLYCSELVDKKLLNG